MFFYYFFFFASYIQAQKRKGQSSGEKTSKAQAQSADRKLTTCRDACELRRPVCLTLVVPKYLDSNVAA